jgi:hypothetical protein
MAVLGNEEVKKRFYYINTDDEWTESGAFCVVFFDNGKEEFVIVDDYVPIYEDDFAFVKARNRKEMWPIIIEKAYAKKYGSYQAIQAGHIDQALAELTNGVPQSFKHGKNQG